MRVTNERLAELLRDVNAGDETTPYEPGNVLLDLRDERALSAKLAEALRHQVNRNHPISGGCDGCLRTGLALAEYDKSRRTDAE